MVSQSPPHVPISSSSSYFFLREGERVVGGRGRCRDREAGRWGTETDRDRQPDRQTNTQTEIERDRERHRQRDTDRDRERQTDRQRQRDRDRERVQLSSRWHVCARKIPYALSPVFHKFSQNALETVPCVRLTLSRLVKEDFRAVPISTPLCSRRSMTWCS